MTSTVTCSRCRGVFPEADVDYAGDGDGMWCKKCVVDADVAKRLGVKVAGADAIADASFGLMRNKAIKHLVVGLGGVGIGVPLLYFMWWAASEGARSGGLGRGFVLGAFATGGGIVEIVRGLKGFAEISEERRKADSKLPQATIKSE